MMVSFYLPTNDAQKYAFCTLLVRRKEAKNVCVYNRKITHNFGGGGKAVVGEIHR